MKKNITYIFLLCLFLISCNRLGRQPEPLLRADVLMQTAPDSALALLEKFSDSLSLKHPSTRAWYGLLLTQARDKNYILHTHDSLMRTVVNYYDSSGDVALQAKAHYYLGRVYQDMEDDPKSVREFMMALPLAKEAKDDKLLCILHCNLGYAFYLQEMYVEADSLYTLAEQLAVQQNDSANLAVILSMLGDIKLERGSEYYVSSETILKHALSLAKKLKNKYLENAVISSLSSLYNYMGNSLEAIRFAKLGIVLQEDTMKHYDYYLIQGKAFEGLAQYDSAVIYLTKSLPTGSFFTKSAAYRNLANIARQQGRFVDALRLMDSCRVCTDLARKTVRKVEIITSLKDILMQQKAHQYNSFSYRYRYYLYSLGIALLLLVAYFRNKGVRYQSLTHTLETSEAEKERLEQLYICQQAVLEQKREQCAAMEAQRVKLELEVQLLMQRINSVSQEDAVALREQMAHLLDEKERLFREFMKRLPVYKQLKEVMKVNKANPDAKEKLSEHSWAELKSEVDRLSDHFTIQLSRKYELLTENDIRFCCLLKLGFKYSELALIYGCEPNAMYKRRDNILKKIPFVSDEIKIEELIREC